MQVKIQKISKTVLILAACTAWLIFAICCWNQGAARPSGTWVNQLMGLLRDTPSKYSVYTYLALAGFPLFTFYLTVLLPDLIRRVCPLNGKALLAFWSLVIALVCFAAFISVIGCLNGSTAPSFLKSIYTNTKAVNTLRLVNSCLTPVSLLLILGTWFLPAAVLFFKNAPQSGTLKPAGIRKVLAFYALLAVLALLLTSGSAVLLALVKIHSPGAVNIVLTMMSKSATDITALFKGIVLAPIIEEIAFRGVMQHHLKRMIPANIALLIVSVCFGLWHRNLAQFIYCSAAAIVWGLIYNASGKLRHTVFLHFMLNLLASIAYSTDSKALLGKYVLFPAIRKWLMNLSLFPAVLMLLLHAGLIFAVTESALYFATGRKNRFIRLIKNAGCFYPAARPE